MMLAMISWLKSRLVKKNAQRIYLDFAATTPVSGEVKAAMQPYFSEIYGNPSAVHREGVVSKMAVEDARTSLGRTLRVRPSDVVFTSGGTESNNLAMYGTLRHIISAGRKYSDLEVITTRIEHPSISEVMNDLVELGVQVSYLDVDEEGLINPQQLETLLNPHVALVTLAYVNSEVGVIQPVRHLARVIKAFNQENGTKVCLHLDACQAPLWLPVQLDSLGCDLLSLDAGKCYGPKGVGVLAKRHHVALAPTMLGGSQEGGLRAGTENVPLVIGSAIALNKAQSQCEINQAKISQLRDYMIESLQRALPDCVVNGPRVDRVANNVNISIPGIDTEFAVISLDVAGVAASTKSACSGADGGGSTVVRVMTGDEVRAHSTIRFSLGTSTTKAEIDTAVSILQAHVKQMQTFQKTLT